MRYIMAQPATLLQELKRKLSDSVVKDPVPSAQSEEHQSPPSSQSLPRSLPGHQKGLKYFAGYLAEQARQKARLELLQSCFLGQKERMSDALHKMHVNDELEVPFYGWEYVIVFENPDYPRPKARGITQTVAESHFTSCFQGEMGDYRYQQDINRQFEKKAFLDAFQVLPESTFVESKWNYLPFKTSQPSKMVNLGGLLKETEGKWTVQSSDPKDYFTLIRNVIQTKLALHVGLKTKLMLSSSGEYIYMLLLADELDLQNEAERINYYLQMELGASDIESMEPCDKNLRPLGEVRSIGLEPLLREIKETEMGLYDTSSEPLVGEEVEDCKRYSVSSIEAEGVAPEQWLGFREFLETVRDGLQQLREEQLPPHLTFKRHQQILEKAYLKVNSAHPKAKIMSLWDRLQIPAPLAAYARYQREYDPTTSKDIYSRKPLFRLLA